MERYSRFHMRSRKMVLFLLIALLCPATGHALDNDYWNTNLGFQFYPPGARALGMGGAFVALADDATAAASNPAGISQLTNMQFAIEGRYASQESKSKSFPWSTAGNLSAFQNANSDVDDAYDLSFGAFTTPLFKNFLNVSVFYDRPMSFSAGKLANRGFQGGPVLEFEPSSTDINIHELGLSVAKSFFGGKVMFGAGVGVQFFDMEQREAGFISPNGAAFDQYFARSVDKSSEKVSYRAGLLVKPIDRLRLGVSYTRMPQFTYQVNSLFEGSEPTTFDSQFDVPDNLSFGAAYNLCPNWVLLFEAKYLMYSQLMNGFVVTESYADAPVDAFASRIGSSVSDYSIDDIVEIHFGTEYVLNAIKNVPIALRAGFYYEPAHDLKYTKPSLIADALGRPRSQLNNIEAGLFDGGDDLFHFTFGAGAVFCNHFQVDAGADITDESTRVALSLVYQF